MECVDNAWNRFYVMWKGIIKIEKSTEEKQIVTKELKILRKDSGGRVYIFTF